MIQNEFTGSLFSFDAAPEAWLTGAISESFFNLTKDPTCFHIKDGVHDWYCKLPGVTSLATPEANYSASVMAWHLFNTGSLYENWTQLY
jgi:hypothetical protein